MTGLRQILRSHQVRDLVGYSSMHLYRLEQSGAFPKRFKLGSDAKTGAVGWWRHEVEQWLDDRDLKRRAPNAA